MDSQSYGLSWIDIPEEYDALLATSQLEQDSDRSFSGTDGTAAHIFIEGDNYPALHCLLKKYTGKINIIYIDPPYNTGSGTFTYNDRRFLTRHPDGSRISSDNPARHSAWLSFMERRLVSARALLQDSGCIFISIGEEEYPRLRLLCDGIFGENNFVNDFMYLHGKGKKDRWSRTMQQSTVCYAKDKRTLAPFSITEKTDWATANADGDPRGPWFSASISFSEERSNREHPQYFSVTSPTGIVWTRQWMCSKQEMDALLAGKRIYFGPAPDYANVPRKKVFNGELCRIIPPNIITADSTRSAQEYLDKMLGVKNVFANPKPVNLISQLIAMTGAAKDAVILDFFAGSGTTLEAVAGMNAADGGTRSCILIQSPEPVLNRQSPFPTVSAIAYERCRRVLCGYTDTAGTTHEGLVGSLNVLRV